MPSRELGMLGVPEAHGPLTRTRLNARVCHRIREPQIPSAKFIRDRIFLTTFLADHFYVLVAPTLDRQKLAIIYTALREPI